MISLDTLPYICAFKFLPFNYNGYGTTFQF